MRNNYPIKYTIVPVYESDIETCYIIEKCFLIGKNICYSDNGNNATYEVVSVYKKLNECDYINQKPIFDSNGKCQNSHTVLEIFDSYQDALSRKNKLNDDLYNSKKIRKRELKSIFTRNKKYYDYVEKNLLEKSSKLSLDIKEKPKKSIVYSPNEIIDVDLSIYALLESYKKDFFAVRTVDYRTFINMYMDFIKTSNNLGDLLLANDPETGIIKVFGDNKCMYLKDNELSCKKGEDVTFVINPDIVIYTLNDYNDILDYYQNNEQSFTLKRKK